MQHINLFILFMFLVFGSCNHAHLLHHVSWWCSATWQEGRRWACIVSGPCGKWGLYCRMLKDMRELWYYHIVEWDSRLNGKGAWMSIMSICVLCSQISWSNTRPKPFTSVMVHWFGMRSNTSSNMGHGQYFTLLHILQVDSR